MVRAFLLLLTSTLRCLSINTTQSFERGGSFSHHGECTSAIITLLVVYMGKSVSAHGLCSREHLDWLVIIIIVVVVGVALALKNTPHRCVHQ